MIQSAVQDMTFSFLTSGPNISLRVPESVSPIPHLTSPIYSGIGARTFAFTPAPEDQELRAGMMREGVKLRTIADRDGRPVELYRRNADPPTWWLLWQLNSGCLTTHIRGVDGGEDRADVIGPCVSVWDEATPFLFLFAPVKPAVATLPGYQETAWTRNYDAGDVQTVGVTLIRPGFVPEGRVVVDTSTGMARVRAGAEGSLEIQVAASEGLDSAMGIVDVALQSLALG